MLPRPRYINGSTSCRGPAGRERHPLYLEQTRHAEMPKITRAMFDVEGQTNRPSLSFIYACMRSLVPTSHDTGFDRVFHCDLIIRVVIAIDHQLTRICQQLVAIAAEVAQLYRLAYGLVFTCDGLNSL